MSLNYAIDALYDTGWSAADSTECERAPDGRAYPTLERVRLELSAEGVTLSIRRVEEFDCCRAEISDQRGGAISAVVGQTGEEAAVFALAQFRRALSTHAAATR